ncbi:Hypothetical predicted protein [Lecanosticta acicola]|uniref:Uncharacterized protein n=1 Tax=Lecanosticta acicola TaxID=111012 RepID=A0AAI8Z7G5_9PEZI|nr:Hypothetical predicted protein [Lecanosticta acicola]
MLVGAGKSRVLSIAVLLIVGFITIATFSYSPSLKQDSADLVRQWKEFTQNPQAPAWVSQNLGKGKEAGAASLPATPPPDTEELPSKNPNPFAAVNEVTGGDVGAKESSSSSSSTSTAEAASEPTRASELGGEEQEAARVHDHLPAGASHGKKEYHEIFSRTTPDRKYFNCDFGTGWDYSYEAINPSIIHHPHMNDTWLMIAQHFPRLRTFTSGWSAQIACDAKFTADGKNLSCIAPPHFLVVPPTASPGYCKGEMNGVNMSPLNLNVGPHDARVFYGPKSPYIIYGSQSHHTCFGQWVQDFRLTWDWGIRWNLSDPFTFQTEVQRPGSYGIVEKNWFLFWDYKGDVYAHYDTAPKRAFAKLNEDGSVGEDLAPYAQPSDDFCWKKFNELNPLPPQGDANDAKASIHQATNSLAITFCARSDTSCFKGASNTFLIQIFQQKIGNGFLHAHYEPYVMVFRREAPFQMHAISRRPLWIAGRSSKSEMLYVTSINWRANQTYHGYIDDVLHVNFGIEDKRSGSIDVSAKDLLGELMTC